MPPRPHGCGPHALIRSRGFATIGLPNGGVGASVGDQMYFRTLLIAILAVCAALFAACRCRGRGRPRHGARRPSPTRRCASRSTAPSTSLPPAPPPASRWPAPRATRRRPPLRPPSRPRGHPRRAAGPGARRRAARPGTGSAGGARARATDPKTEAPGSAKVEPQKIEKGDGIEKPRAEVKVAPKTGSTREGRRRREDQGRGQAGKSDADNGGVAGPAVDDHPLVLAPPLPARSIPNILLDRFQIPPFLLPLYQAAGVQYGVRWEILAAINSIETDYGRNLSVSTAGAVGWMRFMPSTWEMYGVDANGDGRKDPYNPVDAIFAAARYLKAAGAGDSLRRAIFAYNHADWYVNDVLRPGQRDQRAARRGRRLALRPDARPLPDRRAARATRAARAAPRARNLGPQRLARRSRATATAAACASTRRPAPRSSPSRTASSSASATTERLGKFVRLRDAYGNRYVYGHLGTIAAHASGARASAAPAPSAIRHELGLRPQGQEAEAAPRPPARRGSERAAGDSDRELTRPPPSRTGRRRAASTARARRSPASLEQSRQLPAGVSSYDAWFAQPYSARPRGRRSSSRCARARASSAARSSAASAARRCAARARSTPPTARRALGRRRRGRRARSAPLVRGPPRGQRDAARSTPSRSSTAGACSSATKIYGAAARSRRRRRADQATAGQVLLMSKEQLQRHVLEQPGHRRSTSAGARTSAPASSTAACSRRSSTSSPRA